MHRIAINGVNAKTGGGKSILHNYMQLLDRSVLEDRYYLLTTDPEAFAWMTNSRIQVIGILKHYGGIARRSKGLGFFSPMLHEFLLDRILKRHQIHLVFNLGDLVVRTKVKQVYLFDWPYAIYPESVVWKRMDRRDRFLRKTKLLFFKKRISLPAVTIAQTQVAKDALERLYHLPNVAIVPNAVSLDNSNYINGNKFKLPPGKRLLYLTNYYPHKNLEILIPVARRMSELGSKYRIIITVNDSLNKKVKRLLRAIDAEGLSQIIINVGTVAMEDVPSLYRSCHGLLMPTLLESFSGTYVEAMFHGIPIFTSDLDFAKGVCGDAACYFDPDDADDIVNKVETVFDDPSRMATLVQAGKRTLSLFPDWPQSFERYQEIIRCELRRSNGDVDY